MPSRRSRGVIGPHACLRLRRKQGTQFKRRAPGAVSDPDQSKRWAPGIAYCHARLAALGVGFTSIDPHHHFVWAILCPEAVVYGCRVQYFN